MNKQKGVSQKDMPFLKTKCCTAARRGNYEKLVSGLGSFRTGYGRSY